MVQGDPAHLVAGHGVVTIIEDVNALVLPVVVAQDTRVQPRLTQSVDNLTKDQDQKTP